MLAALRQLVFPAHAGMNRVNTTSRSPVRRVPRPRGDEPSVARKRGFTRQEWAKLRERNEALDCAVLARAALWLLGADRYGERYWQRLQTEIADAPVMTPVAADTGSAAAPEPSAAPSAARPNDPSMRPRSWLGQRGGWLR